MQCLEKGQIPPQKHFSVPNPQIDFSRIEIPTSPKSWPSTNSAPRRAPINSFGFGGTDAHIVLEQWPDEKLHEHGPSRPFLFKLSASSEKSLSTLLEQYANHITSSDFDLRDLAYTLLARRSTLEVSKFLVAATRDELAAKLQQSLSTEICRKNDSVSTIGFIFTGQGAQW